MRLRWSGLSEVKLERIVVMINCVGKYMGWLGWVEDAKVRRRVNAVDRSEVISVCGHEQKRWLSESEVDLQRGQRGNSSGVGGCALGTRSWVVAYLCLVYALGRAS